MSDGKIHLKVNEVCIQGRWAKVDNDVYDEIMRLRDRVKEVADAADKRSAKLQSRLDRVRADMDLAREWACNRFDWLHSSYADKLEVARRLAEGDETSARLYVAEQEIDLLKSKLRSTERSAAQLQERQTAEGDA